MPKDSLLDFQNIMCLLINENGDYVYNYIIEGEDYHYQSLNRLRNSVFLEKRKNFCLEKEIGAEVLGYIGEIYMESSVILYVRQSPDSKIPGTPGLLFMPTSKNNLNISRLKALLKGMTLSLEELVVIYKRDFTFHEIVMDPHHQTFPQIYDLLLSIFEPINNKNKKTKLKKFIKLSFFMKETLSTNNLKQNRNRKQDKNQKI